MRALALIALLALASCGDDAPQNQTAPAVASPSPGQWELASQVTRFVKSDHGASRIDTPVGSRATQSLCVAPGARLPTEFFSGEGFTCSYGSYYVRNGNANVTLSCHHDDLTGSTLMTVSGTFGADSVSLHRDLRTILTTGGDVQVNVDVTGRRTGTCTPAAASEGQNRQ